jgi:small subunit ribosomal protein S6
MSEVLGTYREYETIFIMRPDASDEVAGAVRTRVEGVVEKFDAKLTRWDDWGKRTLAYQIRDRTAHKNHGRGLYVYMKYVGNNELVAELERNLRMTEPVLRYMTIRLDGDADIEAAVAELDAADGGPFKPAELE